ncbi:aromatic ring-hydroxylating dioxygenase subunit alpha [Sphingomonas sp. CL5.1]|uniref:aromatic ring-hydroxylating dioxygenase subunit alpha n=1 Tax=Sphingomonas sp. CL5.1 TaxID=2653203 RepID=UPI00158261E2|nr:aromatic ring-hydroxylating dioxygenase subunit alpha [Sphingomonas sp. CL5.1]QKR99778.1 aromatic ring-hydroxylating dioxygenase subunit alpha [Sphingomonas sp. CL5.1]
MTYLRNCWYMAAWSGEVTAAPFARHILDEPILMFRKQDGDAVALTDRCPHRFAPLHLGKLDGDRIQCPYHGLKFNAEGRCVFNPQGAGATPAAASLRRYPLLERYGGLWIWMGDPTRADPALLPDYPFLEPGDRYAREQGYMHTKAYYELLSDNILDLGHVDFLHQGSLGCEATARAKPRTRQEGNRIYCDRWMPDARQGPLLNMLFERDEPVDAWIDVVWDPPGLMLLHFGMTDVGSAREGARETLNVHFMTPESERSTHYFWAGCRSFRRDEPGLGDTLRAGVEAAFSLEDKPMIEAQQAMMGDADFWSLKPVLLQGDAAAVLARRTLAKLIEAEQEAASPAAATAQ